MPHPVPQDVEIRVGTKAPLSLTPVATFKSSLFQNGWLMPEGANVLLARSMREGNAWIGETDESAGGVWYFSSGRWRFFFLYEYLEVVERASI